MIISDLDINETGWPKRELALLEEGSLIPKEERLLFLILTLPLPSPDLLFTGFNIT